MRLHQLQQLCDGTYHPIISCILIVLWSDFSHFVWRCIASSSEIRVLGRVDVGYVVDFTLVYVFVELQFLLFHQLEMEHTFRYYSNRFKLKC